MVQEALPEAIFPLLEKHDLEEGEVLLRAASDLDLHGRVEREWLLVTQTRIAVFTGDGTPALRRTLPTANIERYRQHAVVGSGFLQARLNGVWVNVVRYSNTLAGRFAKLTTKLETIRNGGSLSASPDESVDEQHCTSCGLALQNTTDVCPRCLDRRAVLSRVWSMLRPYRRSALVMSLLVLLGVAADLAPPKLQQYLVDQVLRVDVGGSRPQNLTAALLVIVGTLACTRLLLAVFNIIKGVLANRIGTAMTSDLRGQLVAKLQHLSVDYYDRHPVGVLMSRVAYDTEALYGFVNQITSGFLLQILQVVGVGIMLFTLNAKLAMWTLLPMPLVLYGSWFFWRYVYPKYYYYWDSASKQAGTLAGMLSGIRVVKAFAQEKREYDRFEATSHRMKQARLEVEVSSSTFSAGMQFVFSLGGLIVWYVGGRDVLNGTMTLGALMAFLAYLAIFYTPLTTLAQLTTWLTSFMTASQRVFELLDTPNRICEAERPSALPRMRGHIRFEDVTFGYDRHQPVLKDFSLEIYPGETVGVVGRSGSGKTTLINLICRFYDINTGRVTIDGHDVREIARGDLRRQVGVVLQEPFLFRGTVWENLIYGRPDVPADEALTAAKGANCHDFILRLPLAYDTPLGERGAGLSGGEKQRLSIARTLLYNPRILILDEATSSVDTESEKAIQDALAVLTRGRTTIAIAHRLSTLRNSDRIIVLDHGRLIEEGSHQDLLDRDGTYAQLVRIQTQAMQDSNGDGRPHAKERALQTATAANGTDHRSGSSGRVSLNHRWDSWHRHDRFSPSPLKDADFGPRWLGPHNCGLTEGEYGGLRVQIGNEVHEGVLVIRALPVTNPDRFISLRYADADGVELEIGMVRDLDDWPHSERLLLEQALARRYFIRSILGIHCVELKYGLLTFRVQTDRGPTEFVMRNNHTQAQDYGPTGKMLIDVDDNRYVIEDVERLPRRQQVLFRRYIYW